MPLGPAKWQSSCWPAECDRSLVEAEFAGDSSRVQLVHPVVFVRGLALCLRCGAFSTKRLFRPGTATCVPTAAGRKELRRVFRGLLPTKVRHLPLEPPAAGVG